jgi:hypothetical protein
LNVACVPPEEGEAWFGSVSDLLDEYCFGEHVFGVRRSALQTSWRG